MRAFVLLSLLCSGCVFLSDADLKGRTADPDAASEPDADGDGYASADALGPDCDDGNGAVHPGALDTDQDGLDQDCDGVDGTDGDLDGFASESTGGLDCDDGDAAVFPGAEEICEDGMLNGCDANAAREKCGWEDSDLSDDSTVGALSGASTDQLGHGVSGAGDFNGDGLGDAVVGAPYVDGTGGAAYVVTGASEMRGLLTTTASISGVEWADFIGLSVSGAGDIDADERDDLLVGAPTSDPEDSTDAGAALWVLSSDDRSLDIAVSLPGIGSGDNLGTSVADVGDLNADLRHDFAIGAPAHSEEDYASGAAYLVFGSNEWSEGQSLVADATILGEGDHAQLGQAVSGAGDVNADGWMDVIIGAFEAPAASREGSTYLFLGGTSLGGELAAADADVVLVGENSYDAAGCSLAGVGDVNEDGNDDFLVGAPTRCTNATAATGPGAAYLILGSSTLESEALSEHPVLRGRSALENAGSSVAGAGDVDADGRADMLVGAPFADVGDVAEAGVAYLVLGSGVEGYSLSVDATFLGDSKGDHCGWSVDGAGDMNADGLADLVFGAPHRGLLADGSAAGIAYFALSPGY